MKLSLLAAILSVSLSQAMENTMRQESRHIPVHFSFDIPVEHVQETYPHLKAKHIVEEETAEVRVFSRESYQREIKVETINTPNIPINRADADDMVNGDIPVEFHEPFVGNIPVRMENEIPVEYVGAEENSQGPITEAFEVPIQFDDEDSPLQGLPDEEYLRLLSHYAFVALLSQLNLDQ